MINNFKLIIRISNSASFIKLDKQNCRKMNHTQSVLYFDGEKPPLEKIRTKLLQFEGGEISCIKNEENGIANLCINHPERRNAMSGKMMVDFEKIVNDLQNWKIGKAVLLYGANEIFCSGGDLNFVRQSLDPQTGYEMAVFMTEVFTKFANLPLISVAYISGRGALGGGAEITTYCDFRLFDSNPQTRIGFVHNKMGIVPAWGGTSRLVQIIGRRKALDLILTGSLLNSNEAFEVGLIDGIVDNFDAAMEWILNKVKHDHITVRATKASVVNASQITDEVLDVERRIFAPLWGSSANKLALQKNIKHK